MFCTLQLDGVPLGQVQLTGAPRAIGLLGPFAAYDAFGFRDHAKRLGLSLVVLGSNRIKPEARARSLAAAVANFHGLQERLSLIDIHGDHIAIVHIVVVEFPADTVPVVVAQLREQAAPSAAMLELLARQQPESSRPAA